MFKIRLLVFTLLSIFMKVRGDAYLEIKMDIYENAAGDDWDGSCCDIFCNACDHEFLFSIDQSSGSTSGKAATKSGSIYQKWSGYFQDQNKNVFNADISGVSNPIVQNFVEWPGSVLFKVFVEDNDSPWTGPDDVDGFIQPLALTPQRSKASSQWTSLTMTGIRQKNPTSLYIEYRLYCADNYYGRKCAVSCMAQDSDTTGHYTCDPSTGDIICMPGWQNPSNNCLTRINYCDNSDCRNGGTCVPQLGYYNCTCRVGFAGARCEIPTNIQCKIGFVGPSCDINICDFVFCKNGGSCTGGKCVCPAGFSGDYCEQGRSCKDKPCQNDGTCYDQGFRCDCLPNYDGATCQHAKPPQANATYEYLTDKCPDLKPQLSEIFGRQSDVRDLLIALIIISGIFLLIIIVLIVALCRFRRRARNAEKDCRLMSQGASVSVSTSSDRKISENTYHSKLYSQSSVFTDVESPSTSRSTSLSDSPYSHYHPAEPPTYDHLGDDEDDIMKLKAKANEKVKADEKAPPPVPSRPKVETVTDVRGEKMKLDRKSSC